MMSRVLLIVMLLIARCAFADEAPGTMIRAHLEPPGPVVAGTEVKLVVDALTTTWFTAAPDWPLFTIDDAIVSLPDEQAVNLSETIDDVKWFGVSRSYRIVPRAAKSFDIAPFALTVYPGGGASAGSVKLTTPRLRLTATLPPGAEGMTTFFSLAKLTATQKFEPGETHLRVGDTITRTITQTASGTESMLIPPVAFGDIDGLRRYPKTPATRNIVQDRAGLVAGERTDAVTYVVNRSGRYTLPALTIEWWNTATQKRETIVLPAVSFAAAAAKEKPLFEIPADAMSKASHKIIFIDQASVAYGVGLLLALLGIVWSYPLLVGLGGSLKQRIADARRRYAQGAAPAWRALRVAGRSGAMRQIIPALYRWMDKRQAFGRPARVQNLASEGEDAALGRLAASVAADYANRPAETAIDWNEAERELKRAARRHAHRRRNPPLPPLNER